MKGTVTIKWLARWGSKSSIGAPSPPPGCVVLAKMISHAVWALGVEGWQKRETHHVLRNTTDTVIDMLIGPIGTLCGNQ